MAKKLRRLIFIVAIIVIALWSVWSIAKSPSSSLIGGEDIMIVWILNQTIQKIPHNILSVFQGNIFYPHKNTMAYSVLLIPSAIISSLPVKLSGYPILAYGISLIIGQILTSLVCFFWFYEITSDSFSSFLGTTAFVLSQIRMNSVAHLQMWTIQWFLISSWMIWKYFKYRKLKFLYIAAGFFIIQIWENLLPSLFILSISLAILFTHRFVLGKHLGNKQPILFAKKEFVKTIIFLIFFGLIFTSPVLAAYLSVSRQFSYVRPIREVSHFSMSLNDIVNEHFLSYGLFSLFFVSLLILPKKVFNKSKDLKWVFIVLIFSFLMSLGPVLKLGGKTVKILGKIFIPLPYGILYYVFPFLKAFRTPSRWMLLFAFSLSLVIAISFSAYKSRFKSVILMLAAVLAIFGGKRITKVVAAPTPSNYPKVYYWLSKQDGDAILELPIYTWAGGKVYINEMYRMLYSLEHKKNLVNGASGFYPPDWLDLVKRLSDFPNAELERGLTGMGVDYIVVHKDQYKDKKLQEIENWGKQILVYEDEETLVYKLSSFLFAENN
jgi:hypothetical protein